MLLKIVWKNIVAKKLNSFLCILLMTFGIAIISLIMILGKQVEEKFTRNISGIDMVVGAKGSPLQLILSGIYQIDSPTGNIPLEEVQKLSSNPLVKEIIPLSMGDNYRGFRIVGTNSKYLKHFKAEMAEGAEFTGNMEVVLGATVALVTGLKTGDRFSSSHGLESDGDAHDDHKYVVKGILKPNNSVADNLVLTGLESVWSLHDHGDDHEEENAAPKEVTCALVKFRSPLGLMTLPRNINQNTVMQAALPSIEINRLFELMGVGFDMLKILAGVIMALSGVSVFITLYNSLKERKYEMALMLSMGAGRMKLFSMLLLEGIFLSLAGFIAGISFSRLGLFLLSGQLSKSYHYSLNSFSLRKEEIFLLIAALIVGIFAAGIPSLGVYRINISKTLAED